ncbi:ATPase, partial [Mesorhizobium sp. M00.F.Ca.ET.151.01.1.1]
FSFRADMQVGDYVVVSDGRDRVQALGKVTGGYFYDPDAAFHPHRRHVEWLWRNDEGTERSRFYSNAFRRHSVYKLNQSLVDWDALEAIVFGEETPRASQSARDHVLIIDEINRA